MRIRLLRIWRKFVPPVLQRLPFWLGTLLGMVWALPLTLLGLVLAVPVLVRRGRCHYLVASNTPALLISGPLADLMLERHPFGPMSAMAIGHIVIAQQHGMTPRIIIHELAHVRQAAWLGLLFPFIYIAASGWAALRGQDAYWYNFFEVAARNAENHL